MSLTLGEKLRQAREGRGISLSEVAEQTRISPHYIESIELDNYKPLPGGIFNKGFIKSFAKYVGVDEQEALADYMLVINQNEGKEDEDLKTYKPEVLTDNYSSPSMLPTIIGAAIILALMTVGILFGLNYFSQTDAPAAATNISTNKTGGDTNTTAPVADANSPVMATLKVEFKASNQPVPISTVTDGTKSDKVVVAGGSTMFEPKESLTVNYNKWNADKVQMMINGKSIALPSVPVNPRDKRIEFTISKDNLGQIWTSGSVSTEVPPAGTGANANVTTTTTRAPATVRPTLGPRPSIAAGNTAGAPTPKPAVKPPVVPPRPAANN